MGARPLKTREFLSEVAQLVRMELPEELRGFQVVGPVGALIKFHYGNPKVHYEVWVQRRTGNVEVGLHFEATPEENSRYLSELILRYPHVVASLGPRVEPEQWTASWTRVHQFVPLTVLDEDLLMEVSSRLSQMVRLLQPVVWQISARGTEVRPSARRR